MAQNDGGDQNLGRKGLRRGARLLHAQPKARTSIPTTTPRNEPRYTPAPIRQKFIDLYGREFAGPRRYGLGASTTATSGPVDKTGYLQREVRRKARQNAIQGMIAPTPTPAVPAAVQRGMGSWT
jgi:hypothetical protein